MFLFQLLRPCHATPGFSMISLIITSACFDSGVARGHCLARSVRGGLYIFGDVRMHALCVHVWNRVQKWCFIVFSLLFVWPHMYMRVRLLCVDVCLRWCWPVLW